MQFPDFSAETFLTDIKNWLKNGGSRRATDSASGWSLLHFAAEFQNTYAIEYLIKAGCDPNQRDKNGQTPLHIAVDSEIDSTIQSEETLDYRVTKMLISLGADATIKDYLNATPIDWINRYGELASRRWKEALSEGKDKASNR